jgi:predicted nucleotide-binding protein
MNRKVITERLLETVWATENALSLREDPLLTENASRLKENIAQAARAFSNSWLGYHANVYYRNMESPEPGDHFSAEWGLMSGSMSNHMSGNWLEYPRESLREALFHGVAGNYETRMAQVSAKAQKVLEEHCETARTILDALQSKSKAPTLSRIAEELGELDLKMTPHKLIDVMRPRGSFMSRDSTAVSQGITTPVHCLVSAEEIARQHPFTALETLASCSRKIMKYMEINDLIERSSMPAGTKVFIGHGRSLLWRELKDFLQDRLHLEWEEFNREPTAGIATTERLQQMLDTSCIAFLVMTAEDQHADATLHARENVVHEVGLFQGRLGFRRAIVVLEEGCTAFSNIAGLSQLRFPRGNISASFEEIRRVLEREGIV